MARIGIFVVAAVVTAPLCATHPHFRRRHTSHDRSISHRYRETLDGPEIRFRIQESLFELVSFDVNNLLHDLACKLDSSCSPMMLGLLPGGENKYDELSKLNYMDFIDEMLEHLREFNSQFKYIVNQISKLQSNLILDSNDVLHIHGNMLINDLKQLINYIQKAANSPGGATNNPQNSRRLDQSALYMTFIPELKNFKNFIEQCKFVVHSHKRTL